MAMVTLGLKPSILHQIMLYIVTNAQPLTNRWYYNFMSRWSNEVKLVKPRSLEAARASAATKDVDSYFEELNAVINKYHLGDKPQCIFNIDEKGINTDHRPSGVVRDRNTTIQSVTSGRSQTFTLITGGNAMGTYIPPFFIFPGQRTRGIAPRWITWYKWRCFRFRLVTY